MVVFFDDILIYIRSLPEHNQHFREVLSLLQSHSFYVRKTKCCFGLSELNYLGNIITMEGVQPNPNKISVVNEWPVPTSVK